MKNALLIRQFIACKMAALIFLCLLQNANSEELQTAFSPEKEELKLLDVITNFYNEDINAAMTDVEQLIALRPNFKPAQLLQTEMLSSFGEKTPAKQQSPITQLASLKYEIAQRFNASAINTENKLPSAVIALANKHAHILVVDQSKSRLYLIDNTSGTPKVIGDHYITIGKAGIGKTRQNDNKTPVGIYHITDFLSDESLPEIYGTGAFPINYPNSWDRLKKKTGYGIWLHGVPRSTYSRPPRDSRGCIAISNDSLNKLKAFLNVGSTPIILADQLEWLPANDWSNRRTNIQSVINRWKSDWESLDQQAYFNHYSQNYTSKAGDFMSWKKAKSQIAAKKTHIDVQISALDIYQYPGETNLLVTRFKQNYSSNNYPKLGQDSSFKELYWRLEHDGQWRIVHEVETKAY